MKLKTFSRLWIVVILAATSCALLGAVSNVAMAQTTVLYAMKTQTNGYFYVPTIPTTPTYVKIEMLFNDPRLAGDQTGGIPPPGYNPPISHWPDGRVDIKDIAFIAKCFGQVPGGPRWDYMADVVPDQRIDIRDIAVAARDFGHIGTYLVWPQPSVTVVFSPSGTISTPTPLGFVTIPSGDTSFVVQQSSIAIGALVTFWI
jgi:hypothetical protein